MNTQINMDIYNVLQGIREVGVTFTFMDAMFYVRQALPDIETDKLTKALETLTHTGAVSYNGVMYTWM